MNGGGTGKQAEDAALDYLQRQGLTLVARNYRCRSGEVDLIMEQGRTLVFVEVRYRANPRFGGALESVDARKQAKLLHCAQHYLTSKRLDRPARLDVVALAPEGGGVRIRWVQDAFRA